MKPPPKGWVGVWPPEGTWVCTPRASYNDRRRVHFLFDDNRVEVHYPDGPPSVHNSYGEGLMVDLFYDWCQGEDWQARVRRVGMLVVFEPEGEAL